MKQGMIREIKFETILKIYVESVGYLVQTQ